MKILVIGLGYVGTANAVLLSQHNEVVCYDLNADRINLINNKKSPIEDKEASEYLSEKKLNLWGVFEFPFQDDFDFVINRLNPPFNKEYLYLTQMLEISGVDCINPAKALRENNEKDNYLLINDRINELLERIQVLEKDREQL